MAKTHKGDLVKSPPMPKKLWAAIRWCSDGYHYIDTSTLSSRDHSEHKARENDAKFAAWAKDNPVVAYKEVTVTMQSESLLN